MPILPWVCAHGEAPPVALACAETVDLSPPDDSVDTNAIFIEGEGDIYSFGTGPGGFINKRVVFRPARPPSAPDPAPGGEPGQPPEITLHHNPPQLVLVTSHDRKITEESY